MKNNKKNIWADVVNEENLCDTLSSLVSDDRANENDKNSRDVESYQYKSPLGKQGPKQRTKPKKRSARNGEALIRGLSEKKNQEPLKNRLGSSVLFDEHKPRSHLSVSELDSDDSVIQAISRNLREPKINLIANCVKLLGKKKALELLYATEDIIQKGGLLTTDGDRKRTPGGIYIQLIKNDDSILNCQRSQIFSEEVLKKKKQKALKRLKQRAKTSKKESPDQADPTSDTL